MLNESAKNSLIQGAKDLGVSLNEHQFNQLDAYLELLLKWNKVFNLTSIRDPEEGVKSIFSIAWASFRYWRRCSGRDCQCGH